MKCVLLFFAVLFAAVATADDQRLYLAAGGELTVFEIEAESGRLRSIQSVGLPGAGAFTFSPDGSRLYAMGSERGSSRMATFERKGDGSLALLHSAEVKFRAGYLDVDRTGAFVAGNHYREGKVTLWKLEEGEFRGGTAVELDLEPKAHGANFSPDNRWLLVPATEPNKVFVNAFDAEAGTVVPNDPPFALGPEDENRARHPRHLVFHSKKRDVIYTTNESGEPGVCVWKWERLEGTLEVIQDIVTAPAEFDGKISTATLHLTPDAKYLYVSNRNKAGGSSIVGFRVGADDGRLTLIGHTPCESVPRSFCIDRSGHFVYVAGQNDQRLGVYSIHPATGRLGKVEQHVIGKGAVWVEPR